MDTMRRIKVAAAVAAIVALTACAPLPTAESNETEPAAADVESSTEPLDEPAVEPEPLEGVPHAVVLDELMGADVMEVDSIYVSHVRTEHPEQTADLADDAIVAIGHDACMAFDGGATVDDVMADTIAAGVDAETGAYIVGGGLAVYCAEHLGMLGVE